MEYVFVGGLWTGAVGMMFLFFLIYWAEIRRRLWRKPFEKMSRKEMAEYLHAFLGERVKGCGHTSVAIFNATVEYPWRILVIEADDENPEDNYEALRVQIHEDGLVPPLELMFKGHRELFAQDSTDLEALQNKLQVLIFEHLKPIETLMIEELEADD